MLNCIIKEKNIRRGGTALTILNPSIPNQKTITIKKEKSDGSNDEQMYNKFNLYALQIAMKELSGEKFKMWCYLNKNAPDYYMYLSKVDAVNNWGIGSDSTYQRAIKELIEKGYLQETKQKDRYIFYELPNNLKEKYKNLYSE